MRAILLKFLPLIIVLLAHAPLASAFTLNVSPSTIYAGQSTSLSATGIYLCAGPISYYQYGGESPLATTNDLTQVRGVTVGGNLCNTTYSSSVTFSSPGTYTLIATDGNGAVTAPVLLTVLASKPSISISPTNIDFGFQPVKTTSSPRTVVLSNSGSSSVSLYSITLGSNAGGVFSSNHNCGSTLPPSSSCHVQITFTPQGVGEFQGSLVISSSAGTMGESVYLRGAGTLQESGPQPTHEGPFDPNLGIPASLPPVVKSVVPAGTSKSFNLSTTMSFDANIKGKQGSIFIGARVPAGAKFELAATSSSSSIGRTPSDASLDSWFVKSGAGWGAYQGGAIAAAYSGPLDDLAAFLTVFNGLEISKICGAEIYVGYGTSDVDMLAKNTLGKIYTVMCNYQFSAIYSGTPFDFNFAANIQVATADNGKQGNYYVAVKIGNQYYHLKNGSWLSYGGGDIPVYETGALSDRTFQLLSHGNVTNYTGSNMEVQIGYGLNQDDHVINHKYGAIYIFK